MILKVTLRCFVFRPLHLKRLHRLYGQLGAIDYNGVEYHVDGAVASCRSLWTPVSDRHLGLLDRIQVPIEQVYSNAV